MNLFVDTSVWSLALRRDSPPDVSEVMHLREALAGGTIYTTGLVLQELLQGFQGPRARNRIIDCFSAIAMIVPTRGDHVSARFGSRGHPFGRTGGARCNRRSAT